MSKTQYFSGQQGFTLIELMIVILLMSVILGISIPSYRAYTLRAGRSDAIKTLLSVTAAQERFYLQNGTYAGNAALALDPPNGLGFTNSKSELGYYHLLIVDDTGGLTIGYTVIATVDAANKQKGDLECYFLNINQNGQRGAMGGYVPSVVERCWR
ncbi:MAG: type IV pilin protein [Gammaproteobacteria bacterium]|jgi:type IV pilus assembly protein PilE|nr:hypothetical protein [Chromatiales bacterium]MCP4926016.1 prepilin-type N-terminal cleavage/methylation domain-containing protein [Gammaproteobacteria bacterium]MDP7152847.1 type IV pilin protein [Gammaproteobacteria bacterium]MDP7296972.1 type IV pilin protein [Gammaproteobacteria bacterium]MDP7418645.1 type IV pilin protein [Gammaproteobacteria bacterium]